MSGCDKTADVNSDSDRRPGSRLNAAARDEGRHRPPRSSGDTVRPQADVEGCRVAHDLLRSVVAELSDAEVRRASKLPGWSVGHVLTHLARNAESMCRRIDAAVR